MSTSPEAITILQGACSWCGYFHLGLCPRVKRIDYHPNGAVKTVEFYDREPVSVSRPDTTGDE